jgi:ABC-type phosphate transport system substrate-binding protein
MNKHIALLVAGLVGTGAALAAEVVVIVNPAAGVPTKEQVADIYLGKSRAYTPLDQAETSPIRAEFYLKATGRDLAQVKSAWSRIVFIGKGRPPRELMDATAVKQAVAADPKAIGYIDKSALDASVKAVLVLN